MSFKITNREQLIGAATAIHDWANGVSERHDIDWSKYSQVSVAQAFAPIEIIGAENERVYHLHREFWRKHNYRELLDVTGPLNANGCSYYYHKTYRQIWTNHYVSNIMDKYGIDMATMAKLIKVKEQSVYNFWSFREFIDDPAMVYAFESTMDIPAPRYEEWGRKYRRALRAHRGVILDECGRYIETDPLKGVGK